MWILRRGFFLIISEGGLGRGPADEELILYLPSVSVPFCWSIVLPSLLLAPAAVTSDAPANNTISLSFLYISGTGRLWAGRRVSSVSSLAGVL